MNQMQQQQAALQEKLGAMRITEETGGVSVTVSGTREVVAVKVSEQVFADGDPEQLEDLLVIAANKALAKAAETEQNEAQSLMSNMLPGGLEGLGGMLGG